MGYKLVREILRGAPAEWDSTMVLVAVAIANEANDDSRRTIGYQVEGRWRANGKGWRDGLTEHTKLSPRGVRFALSRLADAGYEMRVQVGKDRQGRPVYAYKGHATNYHVPPLDPRPEPERDAAEPAVEGERRHSATPIEPQRRYSTTAKGVADYRPSPQFPSEEHSPQNFCVSASPTADAPGVNGDHQPGPQRTRPSKQNPLQRAAELIVTAYLAVVFGCGTGDDGEPGRALVTWQQRTLPARAHRTTVDVTRYLTRCYRAAPELMADLADLKDSEGGVLTYEAEPLLVELRAAAKGWELSAADKQVCAELAAWADGSAWCFDDDGDVVAVEPAWAVGLGADRAARRAPVGGGWR